MPDNAVLTNHFSLFRNNAVIGSAAGISAEGVRDLSPGLSPAFGVLDLPACLPLSNKRGYLMY